MKYKFTLVFLTLFTIAEIYGQEALEIDVEMAVHSALKNQSEVQESEIKLNQSQKLLLLESLKNFHSVLLVLLANQEKNLKKL